MWPYERLFLDNVLVQDLLLWSIKILKMSSREEKAFDGLATTYLF